MVRSRVTAELETTDPFVALIEHLAQFIWVAAPDGSMAYGNRFCEEYTGMPVAQALGEGWTEPVHPDDRAGAQEALARAVMTGRPDSWRVRIRRHDGAYRSFISRVAPVFDADHKISCYVGVAIDVENELALEAKATRYRHIVETATEGIWMIDAANNTTFVNRVVTEILGYSKEEMIGRPFHAFLVPEERPAALGRAEKARNIAPQSIRVQVPLRRKDGSTVWIDSVATPMVDHECRYVGGLSIISDVTERKRAEEKLREFSERKQALSRRIMEVQEVERRKLASDLNEKIGAVLSQVSAKLHAAKGGMDARAKMKLEDSIAIVDRAIDQARNMSLELRPRELDEAGLAPALTWYVEQQRRRASIPIELEVHLLERLPPALETTCFRVVQEALSNMIRHARAKRGRVRVSDQGGVLALTISDDGVGFQLEEARRRAAQGASAGLVGMRERVLLAGGQLDIRSVLEAGTEIRVQIPLDRRTGS